VAGERGERITFTNIRERAGWCAAKANATPKMAALLAEAAHASRPASLTSLKSGGICLVYGRGQEALDVATELADRLSVTLLLCDPADALPPSIAPVPILKGRIRTARGHLGHFEIEVDGYAPMLPSCRDTLEFVLPREGARAACDIIFDMSGEAPLFADQKRRDGYLRADPRHPAAVARAMFKATDLVGEFEKPRYVSYDAGICAHARSHKVGCTKCLDHCPTGAIAEEGDKVAIDAALCGGCGSCSALCPTGAVSYAYPQRADLLARLGALISTYLAAGGERPVILFHDEKHGNPLIAAMARHGRGLPTNVLPLSLFSVLQLGHETLAAALALGAEHVVVLAAPEYPDELAAAESQLALQTAILDGLGYPGPRLHMSAERDPHSIEAMLYSLPPLAFPAGEPFAAVGTKRDVARMALAKLRAAAPAPKDIIALPQGAPYGRIRVDVAGCTLCLSCVGACPTGALGDHPDRPQLAFTENACVQCGICVAICPEKVIALEPRYNFLTAAMSPELVKAEEPFRCVRCGKPFGTKSSVERVLARLKGAHAMFQTPAQQRLIEMCDTCRITTVSEAGEDPLGGAPRPRVRTTDDYLAEPGARQAEKGKKPDDFLA
jgi:ferredoxin